MPESLLNVRADECVLSLNGLCLVLERCVTWRFAKSKFSFRYSRRWVYGAFEHDLTVGACMMATANITAEPLLMQLDIFPRSQQNLTQISIR